jgi:HEPN domain-containing protein
MKPQTQEWVAKAEGDFRSLNRELRARRDPNYDAACFHAQQCAEKYLKACLQEAAIRFEKTHNLVVLLNQVLPLEPGWDAQRARLHALTLHAVEVRYPGMFADRQLAQESAATCRKTRDLARSRLGLRTRVPARRSSPARRRRRPAANRPKRR